MNRLSWLIEKIHFAFTRRLFLYTSRKRALILVVHRTTQGKVWEKQYNNSPEYLYELFDLMKQRGFHFVTMDDVMSEKPLTQPAVSVVCDDGFADNLYEAVPIFQKLGIPYCIYLAAGFVMRKNVSLEAMAQYMINHSQWKCKGISRGSTVEEDRVALEAAVDTARNAQTLQDIQKAKLSFMDENGTNLRDEMDLLYLNKEQVKNMSKESLCTFGVHAYHHAQMRRMTETELLYNTRDAKLVLEDITGKPIRHFAYPFGGFDENYIREFKSVKAAGFISGGMFWNGVVTEKFRRHGYMIPRVQISPFMTPKENIKEYERLLK